MTKKDLFNAKKMAKNNPKINMELIREVEGLHSYFGSPTPPPYTLSPALGTTKERYDNQAKLYGRN